MEGRKKICTVLVLMTLISTRTDGASKKQHMEKKRLWIVDSCASAFVKAKLQPSACPQYRYTNLHVAPTLPHKHTHQRLSGGELERIPVTKAEVRHFFSPWPLCFFAFSVISACVCRRGQKLCQHKTSEHKDQPRESFWCVRGLIFMALKASTGSTV